MIGTSKRVTPGRQPSEPMSSHDVADVAAVLNDHAWRWIVGAFVVVVLLQLELIFNRPVNWDEFFHLSEAHAFRNGHLTEVLQVLYARAFFWLPMLPFDSIGQIQVARLFMLGFELATVMAIYGVARHFVDNIPAALAALAYLTGGYILQHGFSYRADPMAAAFLMGAMWILVSSRLDFRAIFAAAALAALALLSTIKIIFYIPAFAALAWLRWREAVSPRVVLARLALLGGATMLFSLLLLTASIYSLPVEGSGSVARTVSTSGTMMFDEGLFPRGPYILGAIATAPLLAALLMGTPSALIRAAIPSRWRIVQFALLLPLASVVVYRNAFPYFYVFIVPPAAVAAAFAVKAILQRISVPVLCVAFVANALVMSLATPRGVLDNQREVIAAVHRIFPEPVAYFDFPGMIVDYPKANFFMTTWGMRKYWTGKEESFVDVMAHKTVPLLILNDETLTSNQTGPTPVRVLKPADGLALRDAFIPHWGPLWVAGRRFPSGSAPQDFTIYVPGPYTVEASSARIDGRLIVPGQSLKLERGIHRFEPVQAGETRLRWGNNLRRPPVPYTGGPVFRDF
ncbi:hypothetical protein [Sphingopyxis alaskensis]|uniref:hypothetical protein n=1 Tax=Sphingopyxis alaskensis TaxID=117207 RepID=UPI00391D29EE